ncbi:MAG TPA: four helix bundle protein [Cyclobacteriaceae bacterium]|nr:four helix bundle protein [Cyclobacteriaceae bacterium]
MRNYKDLKVWEKAHQSALLIYRLTKSFLEEEQYNLVSQIRRSALSVPTNIAEGAGKFTNSDFAKFLHIALGSAHEVEYLLLFSFEIKIHRKNDYELIKEIGEVKAMLIAFIKKVRT